MQPWATENVQSKAGCGKRGDRLPAFSGARVYRNRSRAHTLVNYCTFFLKGKLAPILYAFVRGGRKGREGSGCSNQPLPLAFEQGKALVSARFSEANGSSGGGEGDWGGIFNKRDARLVHAVAAHSLFRVVAGGGRRRFESSSFGHRVPR